MGRIEWKIIRLWADTTKSTWYFSGPIDGHIALKEYPYSAEVNNSYEFKSHGPSIIDELTVYVDVPIAYTVTGSAGIKSIFNISSLQMQATHGSELVPIKLYDQTNTLAKEYPLEDSSRRANRKRRELQQDQYAILPDVNISDILTKENLPANRTLVLDCLRGNWTICVRSQMRVQLKPEQPIDLRISFNVDLNDFVNTFDYLVIFTNVEMFKEGDSTSIALKRNLKPNVIFNYSETPLPIWYIILSLIAGHLLLGAMTYVLYKVGTVYILEIFSNAAISCGLTILSFGSSNAARRRSSRDCWRSTDPRRKNLQRIVKATKRKSTWKCILI